MREYAGPSHAASYAPPRAHASELAPRTPAEHAHDAIARASREVESVASAVTAVKRAHADNDPVRWREQRDVVGRHLESAERCLDAARARSADGAPDAKERLAAAERALANQAAAAQALSEPPRGWSPVSREHEILATLDAPSTGSARAAFEHKEMALKAVLAQLSAAESRVLAERIETARPNDPIATRFARFVPERRQRLLGLLAGARRREAIEAARRPQVQRKTDATTPTPANTIEIAQAGVAGAGSKLPHGDQIQQAFGRHDVSQVRAQIGGAAAAATQEVGAHAYAVGDRVAFASSPDLRTAAHEAAHVVQQRGGVQLAGGIDGGASDPLERHADAVADEVVAGRSAEALLDPFAGPVHSVARSVQRRTLGPPAPLQPATWAYCNTYRVKIMTAVSDRIRAVGLPKPHPRLSWMNHEQAEQKLIEVLWKDIELFQTKTLHRLMEHAYPADLYLLAEQARHGTDPKQWHDELGVALANAFSEPLDTSIKRMGMRLRVQLDGSAHGVPHQATDLVASCPLDVLVAEVMTHPGVIAGSEQKAKAGDDTPGKAFLHGTRHVDFEWAGKEDPALWNWIHVKIPNNATIEDVAAAELPPGSGKSMGTAQAYRIVASPPYFGLPMEAARDVDEMRHFATGRALVDADSGELGRVADLDVLHRSSKGADAAALAQAGPADAHDPGLDRLLGRVETQLGVLRSKLAPWKGVQAVLVGAEQFVARRRADLTHDPKSAHKWRAVVAGQEAILHAVSSELVDIVDQLFRRAPRTATPHAFVDLLGAYAKTASVAHLPAEANPALADARRTRALLPLALTEERVLAARAAVVEYRGASAHAGEQEQGSDAAVAAVPGVMTRFADLRLQAARGERLDAEDVWQVRTDADDLAMRARLATLATTVRQLKSEATAAGVSGQRGPDGSWSLQMVCDLILQLIYEKEKPGSQFPAEANPLYGGWMQRLDRAREWNRTLDLQEKKTKGYVQTAVEKINGEISVLASDLGGMKSFLGWARKEIEHGRFAKLINEMALEIGLMIVTGEVAGAALTAIRGIALAGELASDIRGAGLLWKGAEVFAHAGLQTVASGAIGGEISGKTFAENALGIVLTSAAMRPFHGLLHGSEAVEQQIVGLGGLAKKGAKVGTELAIGTGSGVIASGIAHAVVNNSELAIASRDEWTSQGIALAASAFVSQRTRGMHERIAEAAREYKSQRLERLAKRVDALAKRAAGNAHPSRDDVAALLAERHDILLAEKAAYNQLGTRAHGSSAKNAADLAATGSQFAEVPLELAGLSPVVDGVAYEGTRAQIDKALENAAKSGVDLKARREDQTGVWTLRAGEREITAKELDFKSRHDQKDSGPHDEHAAPSSERDFERIRNGTPGHIRPGTELSNADVAATLNEQMHAVKGSDIDHVIDSFPAAQRDRARIVLARASGFGSMESLNALRKAMQPHLADGARLYAPGRGSLADNITYLSTKNAFDGVVPEAAGTRIVAVDDVVGHTMVVLDDVVQHQIKTEPTFAKKLVDRHAILLQPRGFDVGNTMYNTASSAALAERTSRLLKRSQEIHEQAHGKLTFDDAVTMALDEGALHTLRVADPTLTGQVEVVDAAAHPDVSSAGIAKELAGGAGISEADIEKLLARLPEQRQSYARELLVHEAQVYSTRRVATELVTRHQQLMHDAAAHGIKPQDVYFYISRANKSYGMMAMAHRQATSTPIDRYLNGASDLTGHKLGARTMVVVLDDVAGTGNSLLTVAHEISETGYKGRVVLAPMIADDMANELFLGNKEHPEAAVIKDYPNMSFEPGRLVHGIKQSEFYKRLPPAEQEQLLDTVGTQRGYLGGALSVVFPYMAPDNNLPFFGDLIAKFFIANRNRRAAKSEAWKGPKP
jgi:uncharacterized protein DUF4157